MNAKFTNLPENKPDVLLNKGSLNENYELNFKMRKKKLKYGISHLQ